MEQKQVDETNNIMNEFTSLLLGKKEIRSIAGQREYIKLINKCLQKIIDLFGVKHNNNYFYKFGVWRIWKIGEKFYVKLSNICLYNDAVERR